MSELEIITTIEQPSMAVKLSVGQYTVKPLTIRRLAKLAALLKDVRGDGTKLEDPESPEFSKAITDMLISAGDNMPRALGIITGDPEIEKFEDVTLHDLGAVVLAAAKVNKANKLKDVFLQAKEELLPEAK